MGNWVWVENSVEPRLVWKIENSRVSAMKKKTKETAPFSNMCIFFFVKGLLGMKCPKGLALVALWGGDKGRREGEQGPCKHSAHTGHSHRLSVPTRC